MKNTYYVSVQNEAIFENKENENFEFEISATDDEYKELQSLFVEGNNVDNATFVRAHIPAVPYHNDEENDAYDEKLKEIYQKIHELGTPETKDHIEQMGII